MFGRSAHRFLSLQSRVEFLSLAGLRVDGRRPNETRRLRCRLNVLERADGSAYLEMGNTKVLVSVSGPQEVTRRRDAQHDSAVVKASFSYAPFAGIERKERHRGDRKQVEATLALQSVFSTAVLTELYPRSQINISAVVLDADGGELCAAINATSLALQAAGVALKDVVTACGVGFLESTPMLDLNHLEASSGCPDLPVAYFASLEKLALVQCASRLPLPVLDDVLTMGIAGAKEVHAFLDAVVKEHIAHTTRAAAGMPPPHGAARGDAVGTTGTMIAVDVVATQGGTQRLASVKLIDGEEEDVEMPRAAGGAGGGSHAQLGAAEVPRDTQGHAAGMG